MAVAKKDMILKLNRRNANQLWHVIVCSVENFEQTKIMNFLDKHPSENRMKYTKLKVACKYASIGRGCVCH